jgi:M6 family metalloprotease-like protein
MTSNLNITNNLTKKPKSKLTNNLKNLTQKILSIANISILLISSLGLLPLTNLQVKAETNPPTTNPTSCPNGQFLLEYFKGTSLEGDKMGSRCEAKIDFAQAQNTAPNDGIWPPYNWSVRFSGKINFEPGKYKFTMRNDDGGRLFIDNKRVIDSWFAQDGTVPTFYETELSGLKEIKMDYYQTGGGSLAKVDWEKIGESEKPKEEGKEAAAKKIGYLNLVEGLEAPSKNLEDSHTDHKHNEKWSFIDLETKKEVQVKVPEIITQNNSVTILLKDKVGISFSTEDWQKAINDPNFIIDLIDVKPLALPINDPFLGNNFNNDFWYGGYKEELGAKKYVTIMCKFPDVIQLPTTQNRLNEIINGNGTATSLANYYSQVSRGKMTFSSDIYSNNNQWYTMPRPENFYTGPNFVSLRNDCINAANPDINFPDYDGINLIYNGETWNDGSAYGGPQGFMFLDGQFKSYGATYIPPWVYRGSGWYDLSIGAFVHEIGHSLNLPHSSTFNPDGSINEYGSRWDVMSGGSVLSNRNYEPIELNAYYKDRFGWIEDSKRARINNIPQVIEIESNGGQQSQPNTFQIAYTKNNINSSLTYSIESRFYNGFDRNLQNANLPESVVIHSIRSGNNSDRRGMMVSSLSNIGSTFTGENGLAIRLCEKKTNSFVVAINSPCPGSIGNQVWEDLNNNNVKDPNETGINGIKVTLFDTATNQVATNINNQPIPDQFTTTVGNEQGFYRFTNLRPGTYRVNFSNIRTNMTLVAKTGNLNDPNNSDVNPNDSGQGVFATDPITLTAGQNIDYVDAGVRKIITPNRVLALGNQATGVTGHPDANFTNPKYIDGMTNVQKIVTNGLATIFLKQDGTVWTTGSNKCGDLGNSEPNFGPNGLGDCDNGSNSNSRIQKTPIQITSLGNDNKDIDTFAVLKNNGEVFAWGMGAICKNNQSIVENGCVAPINISVPKRVIFNGQPLTNITKLNKGGLAIANNGVWYNWYKNNEVKQVSTYQSPAPVNMTQVAKIYQLSWSTPVYTLMNNGTLYEGNTQVLTGVKDMSTNYINGQNPASFNLYQTYVLKTDGSLLVKGYGLGGGTTQYTVVTDKNNNPLVNINSIGAELGVYAMDNNGKLYKELSGMTGLNNPDWYAPFVRPFITIADTNSNAVFLIDRPAI